MLSRTMPCLVSPLCEIGELLTRRSTTARVRPCKKVRCTSPAGSLAPGGFARARVPGRRLARGDRLANP